MRLEGIVNYHIAQALPLPPVTTLMDYVLAGNGVFKRAANPHLLAVIPVVPAADGRVRGLACVSPEVRINYPRASEALLEMIFAEACRATGTADSPKEILFQLCPQEGGLVLVQPTQQTTATSIHFTDAGPDVVADIHSHHRMAAEFSGRDDASETGLRLYAVVGDLFSRPALRLRVGVYGDFWPVPVTTLFTGLGPFVDLCPNLKGCDTSAAWPHSVCDFGLSSSANPAS